MSKRLSAILTASIALAAATLPQPAAALEQEPAATDGPGETGRLPDGLFDGDRLVRIAAIEQVEREKNLGAAGKLADLARHDAFSDVRAAACRALGAIGAADQLELLVYLQTYDANADVRAAAGRAVRALTGEPERPIFPAPADPDSEGKDGEIGDDGFPMPSLLSTEIEPTTRHLAFGLGTMGGFGIAAFDVRGRIATGSAALPWVGLEIGGGWTPPNGYQIVSGMTADITDDDVRWKLISGAASVLLYFHRWHYVPIRGGFDIGQGPYAILGYGFEHLNEEGFFSWGVEIGLLYHPVVEDWIGNVTDCSGDACASAAWPVIPFVRFSLHFYPV